MKKEINTTEFVEILKRNDFNNKFRVPQNYNINELANNTIHFIKEGKVGSVDNLKNLSMILNAYKIPINEYFNFLYSINEIDFEDKEYKKVIIDGYIDLLKEIENSNMNDMDKILAKIKTLYSMEESRKESEERTLNYKKYISFLVTAVAMATTAGGTILIQKYLENKRFEMETLKKINKTNAIKENLNTAIIGLTELTKCFLKNKPN